MKIMTSARPRNTSMRGSRRGGGAFAAKLATVAIGNDGMGCIRSPYWKIPREAPWFLTAISVVPEARQTPEEVSRAGDHRVTVCELAWVLPFRRQNTQCGM
jgi:hypothetical protein